MAPALTIPGTLAVLQLRQLARALRKLDIDPSPVFGRVGMTMEQLDDETARIAAGPEFAIWEAVRDVSGDPLIALKVAQVMGPGALGAYEYLIRNSLTGRVAIERAGRYARYFDDLTRVELIEDAGDELAGLRVSRAGEYPHSPFGIECAFAIVYGVIASTAPPGLDLHTEVHFAHRGEAPAAEYERFFGCSVRLSAAHNQLLFARGVLEFENSHADPRLAEVLELHVQHTLAQLPHEDPFLVRARTLLASILTHNQASLERLAEELHTSTRTLRRRLELLGTSYKALLDSVRKDLALYYVRHTDETYERIAQRLGFSEPSTFYRAFRRWYESTPALYRAKA
jgi:AraC-like DNA-binding protein